MNPLQVCDNQDSLDVQRVYLSDLDASSFFVLEFTSRLGQAFATHPLPLDASAGQIQRALERLPNMVLPQVRVTRDGTAADSVDITFVHPETYGKQELVRCNPQALMSQCGSGTQPHFVGDSASKCAVSRVGLPETDSSLSYYDVSVCSNQGLCDGGTGSCQCFYGFYGLGCEKYAQLA